MWIPVTVKAFGEFVVYVLIMGLIVTLFTLHDVLVMFRVTLVACQVMVSCLGSSKQSCLGVVTGGAHYRCNIVAVGNICGAVRPVAQEAVGCLHII